MRFWWIGRLIDQSGLNGLGKKRMYFVDYEVEREECNAQTADGCPNSILHPYWGVGRIEVELRASKKT
jgi:hypothetical protein